MNRPDEIAEALADGLPVDWAAALGDASTPDEREAIEALRDLAAVAQAFAGAGTAPGRDSARAFLPPGGEWGGLRIVDFLGCGRFGEVYRAWDPVLEREVALKLIHGGPDAVGARVIDEGRLMARIRHPNVVTIHSAQRIDGISGLWMELINGQTLAAELAAGGPFNADNLVGVASDLAAALGAVHQAGLVHRDVKASNVMREAGGRIVLGDFGTGLMADGSSDTQTGLAGTPAYIAPEIYDGCAATPQSDLYSLGVLLFFLATGQYPVVGRTLRELRDAHAAAGRASVAAHRPDLPARLVTAIDRLLDPNPAMRLANASAVLDAIRSPAPTARRRRALAAYVWMAVLGTIGFVALQLPSPWEMELPQPKPLNPALLPQVPPPGAWNRGLVLLPEEPAASGGPPPPGRLPIGPTLVELDPRRQATMIFRGAAADGWIACQNRVRGNVAVCSLQTGTVRILRDYESARSFAPQGRSLLLSPDGRRVAYAWINSPGISTLNVIDAAGGESREVHRYGQDDEVVMHRWLADGSALLVSAPDGNGRRAFLLPVDAGPRVDLWHFGPEYGLLFDLSPDGRHLIVTFDHGAGEWDVRAIDRETRQQTVVFNGSVGFPLWTPTGGAIVFQASREGGSVIMRVPMRDGRPAGPAVLAWRFGRATVRPMVFGADGSLFVIHQPPAHTAYRVETDLTRATVGTPRLVDPSDAADTIGADWSPDASRIAYLRGTMHIGPQGPLATLVVRRIGGGIVDEVELPGSLPATGSQVRWSPDGRRIAVAYGGATVRDLAIDVIDLDSHARDPVVSGVPFCCPRWDGSGDWLYYRQGDSIMRRHLPSGATERAYRAEGFGIQNTSGFDLARADGALAILAMRPKMTGCVLRIAEASGAIIDRHIFVDECVATAWNRDGSALIVSTAATPVDWSLWRLDRAAGDPTRLPIDQPGFHDLAHSPAGLLYTTGNSRFAMMMLTGIDPGPR